MFHRSIIEVTWYRTRGTSGRDQRVVVRRGGGPEQTFGSLAELPPDARQMVEGFLNNPDGPLSVRTAPRPRDLTTAKSG
ncbi:MAG: hypothetical protein HYS13_19745 [Planctomycetia bacterium]|nr:hypothetical protein [Planctomycetia bacterium]